MINVQWAQQYFGNFSFLVRVLVIETEGSTPREVGAEMWVGEKATFGTIGGGQLEFQAIQQARKVLGCGKTRLDDYPLGPNLGQCCGGRVKLYFERLDTKVLEKRASQEFLFRPIFTDDEGSATPLIDQRQISDIAVIDGWLFERLKRDTQEVWIYGAGHIGKALINALLPFQTLRITWVDTAKERFPDDYPDNVQVLIAKDPSLVVPYADDFAVHLIMSYDHGLDLSLCDQLLSRSFGYIGLIGSKTKWARFQKRLNAMGHAPEHIEKIHCPIGDPSLGKQPEAIAAGVLVGILKFSQQKAQKQSRVRIEKKTSLA